MASDDTAFTGDEGAKDRRTELLARFEGEILSGRFGPGERLPPERELAEDLGASRPLLRAVLGELETRGLVKVEARRGAYVADWRKEGSIELLLSLFNFGGGLISPAILDGLLELRILFETETARLAALRRSEAELAAIETVVARERLLEYREPRDATILDYDFHLAVALASGNAIYPLLMNSFKRVYELVLDRFYADPGVLPEVFRLHKVLARAIEEADPAAAAATMREILVFGERGLRAALESPGAANAAGEAEAATASVEAGGGAKKPGATRAAGGAAGGEGGRR